jgi:protein TonB
MIWTEVLPPGTLKAFLTAPPPPPPPPPPPAEAPKTIQVKAIPRQFDSGKLMQPKAVPTAIAVIKEDELPPPTTGGVPGGFSSGVSSGLLSGILNASSSVLAPPPKKLEAPKAVTRIVVGGKVQEARIQGHVILSAIISKEGTIQDLKFISGHPLLAPAAIAAVKQWKYQPLLLNGEAVEVSTEIDVNFTLQ